MVVLSVFFKARVALVAGEVSHVLVYVVVQVVRGGERVLVQVVRVVRREVVLRVAPHGGAACRLIRRRLAGQQVQLLLAGALGRYVGASGCVGPIAR